MVSDPKTPNVRYPARAITFGRFAFVWLIGKDKNGCMKCEKCEKCEE